MKIPKKFQFVGGRILKTGIAVLITAVICHLLQWPAMFAVITAIVTIEPTAADSIKKAFIRFPASAIGAAFSVLFTFLFGDSSFSYAFVALATIITCHKFKLYDGTLVATLTGVAMISTVHDQYVSSFIIRLATTSTGLIVSSLVNLFVIPPKYSAAITQSIQDLFKESSDILKDRMYELVTHKTHNKNINEKFQQLIKGVEKTERLCLYQKDEWKYHRFNRKEIRDFHYEYKKLILLRQMVYHIGNLMYLPSLSLDKQKTELILTTIESLNRVFYEENNVSSEKHRVLMRDITSWFTVKKTINANDDFDPDFNHISSETTILYEILSLHNLAEELCKIGGLEKRHQQLLERG